MVEDATFGTMARCMTASGEKIKFMVKEFMCGLMDADTRENGKITTCTEEVYTHGKMAENTREKT